MNTKYSKLYVDDIRNIPDDEWDVARTYDQAIYMLGMNNYDVVSLDHDLGDFRKDGREMTGYDVLMYLVERKENNLHVPATIYVHTANPPARIKMISTIQRYWKSIND